MGRLFSPAGIVLAAVPIHVGMALATELSPDEAYYACAARFGAIPDHPPLVPWLLRALQPLARLPLELRVRLPAIVTSALAAWLLAELTADQAAARLTGAESGTWHAAWRAPQHPAWRTPQSLATLFGTWLLLPATGGFVTTPDGPASVAWLAALMWAGSRARRPALGAVTSVAVALGAIAKVSVVPAAVVAAAVVWRRNRHARPQGTWCAAREPMLWLLGVSAAAPWWIPSLGFQLRHAFAPVSPVAGATWSWSPCLALAGLGASVGSLVLLFSPPVVWLGVTELRHLAPALRATAVVFAALNVVSSVVRGHAVEPNWWLPAALPLVVAASVRASRLSARALLAIVLVAIVPTLVAMGHAAYPFLPLPPSRDPTARLHGWRGASGPKDAPGMGSYALAAEACVYQGRCTEIANRINWLDQHP